MAEKNDLVKKGEVDKIEWKGIDGLLICSFFIVSLIIWISIINKIDIIIGYIIPAFLAVVVTVIFVAYLKEIYKFYRNKN